MSLQDVQIYLIDVLEKRYKISGPNPAETKNNIMEGMAGYPITDLQGIAQHFTRYWTKKTFGLADIEKVARDHRKKFVPSSDADSKAWVMSQEIAHGKVFVKRNSPEWKALQSSKYRKPGNNYFMSKAHGCEGWHWTQEQVDEIRTREFYNG